MEFPSLLSGDKESPPLLIVEAIRFIAYFNPPLKITSAHMAFAQHISHVPKAKNRKAFHFFENKRGYQSPSSAEA